MYLSERLPGREEEWRWGWGGELESQEPAWKTGWLYTELPGGAGQAGGAWESPMEQLWLGEWTVQVWGLRGICSGP